MTSEKNGSSMNLSHNISQEQIDVIEKLAGVNYTPQEIAVYLGVNEQIFMAMFDDPDSNIRFYYDRGKLMAKAKVDMAVLDSAQGGNITAVQIMKKSTSLKDHAEYKRRILNGY